MDKKQIGIIVVIGVIAFAITMGIMYLQSNKSSTNTNTENTSSTKKVTNTEIKVGNYTIKYGKYKGVEEEYDPDNDIMNKKNVFVEITETMIKTGDYSETYIISGNKLVTSNRIEYEVIENNKIVLLAGGGIEYEYQG